MHFYVSINYCTFLLHWLHVFCNCFYKCESDLTVLLKMNFRKYMLKCHKNINLFQVFYDLLKTPSAFHLSISFVWIYKIKPRHATQKEAIDFSNLNQRICCWQHRLRSGFADYWTEKIKGWRREERAAGFNITDKALALPPVAYVIRSFIYKGLRWDKIPVTYIMCQMYVNILNKDT